MKYVVSTNCDCFLGKSFMSPKMIKRIAYTLFFALCALAAQATEHRVVDGLPKQMVGSWCRETDNDDRDFFTRFGQPLLFDHEGARAGEILKVCPMWMLWLGETGFSQSGELCDFEKTEETAPGVYLVHAKCEGQSGVEGEWANIFEFEIINGHLVITYVPQG
jgi:hypothetical protein